MVGIVSHLANPQAGKSSAFGCLSLFIQYIYTYCPYVEATFPIHQLMVIYYDYITLPTAEYFYFEFYLKQ
jgi:hypothetical protein